MLATRVTLPFYDVVKEYLARDSCINESDLIRKALSEYMKREIPDLYREIMDLR